MTAPAPKPNRHLDCRLVAHCKHCGWVLCTAHKVFISNRPGLTRGNEIPEKKT